MQDQFSDKKYWGGARNDLIARWLALEFSHMAPEIFLLGLIGGVVIVPNDWTSLQNLSMGCVLVLIFVFGVRLLRQAVANDLSTMASLLYRVILITALVTLGIMMGMILLSSTLDNPRRPWIAYHQDIRFTIQRLILSDDQTAVLTVSPLMIAQNSADPRLGPLRLRIRRDWLEQEKWPQVGDTIEGVFDVRPHRGVVFPGGADFRVFFWWQGLVGNAFLEEPFNLKVTPVVASELARDQRIRRWMDGVRARLTSRINLVLADYPNHAGVVTALVTGNRRGISTTDMSHIRRSGLSHLLAISGLHIGLVMFFGVRLSTLMWPLVALSFTALRRRFFARGSLFSSRFDPEFWLRQQALNGTRSAVLLSATLGLCFAALVDFPLSTQRALIMGMVVLLGMMIGRSGWSVRGLTLAAMIIIFFHPNALSEAGFQLSFVAMASVLGTLSIFRGYDDHRQSPDVKPRDKPLPIKILGIVANGILRTMILSVMIGSILSPIIGSLFQESQPYSVVSNVIAIPLFSFVVMPLLFSALLLELLIGNVDMLWLSSVPAIEVLLQIARTVAQWPTPLSSVGYPQSSPWLFVIPAVGILLMAPWRWKACGLIVALAYWLVPMGNPQSVLMIVSSQNDVAIQDNRQYQLLQRTTSPYVLRIWEKSLAQRLKPAPLGRVSPDSGLDCNRAACTLTLRHASTDKVLRVMVSRAGWIWNQVCRNATDRDGRIDLLVADRWLKSNAQRDNTERISASACHDRMLALDPEIIASCGGVVLYSVDDGWLIEPVTDHRISGAPWDLLLQPLSTIQEDGEGSTIRWEFREVAQCSLPVRISSQSLPKGQQ